ncbi:Deacetoxyvindoline 4-hydroxylase [Capsicum baccatum]|uniref:Deacetoxyvindoline 4-hydroxylase n=1 Tax=Capsicum baccatum TaxID=33114 RepID=A0A2G2W181_CAPBA|nr:Deacetoxyvindoline 4-hydroxylase [Capsicum baccatum]
MSELKAFDDTKAGVKGLVDAGITKVPQIFIPQPNNRAESPDTCETQFTFPVIDLEGIDKDPIKHKEIVDRVRDASETWGFFQVKVKLGLDRCHLEDMDCAEGLGIISHYYPACPLPELTIGINKHSDGDFITVLLQDHIGGLQVLHHNQWIDVPPKPGSLVLISNDKYISVEHRVLANKVGPRISVACFFSTGASPSSKLYGPIAELLSEDNSIQWS